MKKPGLKITAFLFLIISFLLIFLILYTGCELYIVNPPEKDTKKTSTEATDDKNPQFTDTGVINKIIVGPVGTFSEYSYYILDTGDESDSFIKDDFENILFNKEDNSSRGFDEYVDKKLKITGKETIGFVGSYPKKPKPGILVEEITIINY